MEKVINAETLEILRDALPRGAQKEIAIELGVSVQAISQFLRGKTRSEQIEIAVLEKVAEIRARKIKLYKKAGLTFK